MKKLRYSSLLFCLAVAVACQSNPLPPEQPTTPVVPAVSIETKGFTSNAELLTLPQEGSIVLRASVGNTARYTAAWSVDDKQVSTDNEFTFVATELGAHTVVLHVTNYDGGRATATLKLSVYGKYRDGTFVLNEGNMSSGNGSLLFISPDGTPTDSVYWRENGSFLGNTAQDLYITDQKLYIVSQNGKRTGGDGILVVANAETLKKEAAYNDELSTLSWPTHVAVVGENAYIRDNKGVSRFNLTTRVLTPIAGTKNAAKNRMAVVGNKVFVPSGKSIYVIKDGDEKTMDTIELKGPVSGVVKSYDKNLWVSCTTSPAQIIKVNATDFSIIRANELGDAKIGAGFGASPALSAVGDTIYFCNATTKIYRHIFGQGKTEYLTDVKSHVEQANIVYNSPAVDPQSGALYFNSIKGYGMDYLINELTVFDLSGYTPAVKQRHNDHTQFPAGIFFTYNFQ